MGLTSRTQPLNPAFGEGTFFCIDTLGRRIDTFLSDTTTQGNYPTGALTLGANGNYGCVYEYAPATHTAVITNFNSLNGCYPNGGHLTQATHGNFYGMTLGGAVIFNTNLEALFLNTTP